MEKMIIVTSKTKRIPLGVQGENLARAVIFNLTDLVDGTPTLFAKRSKDSNVYPVSVKQSDGKIIWELTSIDTAYSGYGEAELFIYKGDTLIKSIVYETYVLPSLEESDEVPEAYKSWVDNVTEQATVVESAKKNGS